MDWIALSIVLACLLISAFFSASETALTGASRASMLRLSKQGNSEALFVSRLFAMRERMIGALLLGNNIGLHAVAHTHVALANTAIVDDQSLERAARILYLEDAQGVAQIATVANLAAALGIK